MGVGSGLFLSVAVIIFCGALAYSWSVISRGQPRTHTAAKRFSETWLRKEDKLEFGAQYQGVAGPELRIEAQRFIADYEAMLAILTTDLFLIGACDTYAVDGTSFEATAAPGFPQELIFKKYEIQESSVTLKVIALDEGRFPEVWRAFREACWLTQNADHDL